MGGPTKRVLSSSQHSSPNQQSTQASPPVSRFSDKESILSKVYFQNYENFGDMNKDYENFIQKLMIVIDKLAPFKTKRVKGNSQKWFDREVLESIALRNKLFRKFKHSKITKKKSNEM